jgi:hypothetical protein
VCTGSGRTLRQVGLLSRATTSNSCRKNIGLSKLSTDSILYLKVAEKRGILPLQSEVVKSRKSKLTVSIISLDTDYLFVSLVLLYTTLFFIMKNNQTNVGKAATTEIFLRMHCIYLILADIFSFMNSNSSILNDFVEKIY